jgi:hypothetical protein
MLFGVLWGLMIFNIDRFIVTSTGKGDGTEAITWDELKGAIPRLIMGAIIALTISKPVEIRMFKTEIDAKLYEEQLKLEKEYEIRTRTNFENRILDVNREYEIIQNNIDRFIRNIQIKDSLYNVETASGQGGRIKGEGPVAIALKAERERMERQLDAYKESNKYSIDQINKRKEQITKEMGEALSNNKKVANGLDGLLERIKLAHEIAGWVISLFITLLFMAIELTPIFFKLMLVKTPYDYLEDNIKELIKAENGIEIRYDYYKDKTGQERHLVINHQAHRVIHEKVKAAEAQKELINFAIDKYVEETKRKIADNPEDYIKRVEDGES